MTTKNNNNRLANHVARFVSRARIELCTRIWYQKIWYQINQHTCNFLVPVSVTFVAGFMVYQPTDSHPSKY